MDPELILTDDLLLLVPLTLADSAQYASMYKQRQIWENFREVIFREGETDDAFTLRIRNGCIYIWTIRLFENPELIIGDIALHDWNQQTADIEFGGTLYPEFHGRSLMRRALELVMEHVKPKLAVKTITGKTTPDNHQAIRMAEKAGFIRVSGNGKEVVLRKNL